MSGVLTGGSAAALYAPDVYMSRDADFIMEADDMLTDIAVALKTIDFNREGRSRLFSHPECEFTVDFPKGPLAVGGDYVRETHELEQEGVRLRILAPFDCIRDRLAHFYHWDDYTALKAAVGVAAAMRQEIDLAALEAWTSRESPKMLPKLAEFKRRLKRLKRR